MPGTCCGARASAIAVYKSWNLAVGRDAPERFLVLLPGGDVYRVVGIVSAGFFKRYNNFLSVWRIPAVQVKFWSGHCLLVIRLLTGFHGILANTDCADQN